MTRWEYKIINVRSENYRLDPGARSAVWPPPAQASDRTTTQMLNELGQEGWELVGITSVNFKTGATDNVAFVFKRPIAG
ncbi:MAG TPA: DUF4177 domain-containing protein [Thermoanaerobaculia bacterium]|nr:DUF4177 domain-containing protein [Thermoanaerobaculia bacterium]